MNLAFMSILIEIESSYFFNLMYRFYLKGKIENSLYIKFLFKT